MQLHRAFYFSAQNSNVFLHTNPLSFFVNFITGKAVNLKAPFLSLCQSKAQKKAAKKLKNTKSLQAITEQLTDQGIIFKALPEAQFHSINTAWKSKFIGKLTAPNLDHFKWHIFSFNPGYGKSGAAAVNEYARQYPCDLLIFDEQMRFCLKVEKSKLPQILPDGIKDDIYICHSNMKWTFVIPHEIPLIGPFFSYGAPCY